MKPNKNYKTKPCALYHIKKLCPYGDRCNFIHGEVRIRNNDLKSVLCDPLTKLIKDYELSGKQ